MGTNITDNPPLPLKPGSPASPYIKVEPALDSSSISPKPSLQVASASAVAAYHPHASSSSFEATTDAAPATASLQSLVQPDNTSSPIQQQHSLQQPPRSQPQLSQRSVSLDGSSPSVNLSMATVETSQPAHLVQPFAKPIRFVANNGPPHAKRRRISAACMTCRKRKTRCSGERPRCDTCRRGGHTCLGYADPANSTPVLSHQTRRQQNQARSESTSATVTTAPDRPPKETSLTPTPSSHELRGTESSAKSQKRGSTNCHDIAARGHEHDLDGSGNAETDEGPNSALKYPSPPSQGLAHRMPYFRYFGPTAIVPGYKQMVVESINAQTEDIPLYDPTNPAPNSPLIAHLVDTFFSHMGCNFPFLRREVFTKDVEEKRVERILVDAVCAVAARFSNDSLLQSLVRNGERVPSSEYGTAFATRAKKQIADTFTCPQLATVQAYILLAYVEFGSNRDSGLWMFLGNAIRMAQDLGLAKLKATRGDSEGRGEAMHVRGNRSSDVKAGRNTGNAPVVKLEGIGGYDDRMVEDREGCTGDRRAKDMKARERERADTFWAVFFLDRVISSGTGRPVTIRDQEIEIDFPPIEEADSEHEYPPPFPALIRIIHLYGRITDLLNSIKDVHTVTPEILGRLSGMEADLTKIYQRLSPMLHFGVVNFQHYARTNQGEVFLLLHFWFHTLIVLLHRPTLLIAFEGRVQQLVSNSRELSMSSAKTIADILAFSELLDSKTINANPFTSQPIYIAACAFLQESAAHSASSPTSRSLSPPPSGSLPSFSALALGSTVSGSCSSTSRPPTGQGLPVNSNGDTSSGVGGAAVARGGGMISGFRLNSSEEGSLAQEMSARHTLLAQVAHQNYQRCHKALSTMETYWEGVKYILTVMDQKAKGIVDPLLYTVEEMKSVEVHRWGAGVWSRFRGNLTPGVEPPDAAVHESQVKQEGAHPQSNYMPAGGQSSLVVDGIPERAQSPLMSGIHGDPSQAIGWSVDGTTNSPNSNLTLMFPASGENGAYPVQNGYSNVSSSSALHGNLQQAQDPRTGLGASEMNPQLSHRFVGVTPAPTASLAASPQSKHSIEAPTPADADTDAEMLMELGADCHQQQQQKSVDVSHHSHHQMDGLVMDGGDMYNGSNVGAGGVPGAYSQYGIMIESENVNMNSGVANHFFSFLQFLPHQAVEYNTDIGDRMPEG